MNTPAQATLARPRPVGDTLTMFRRSLLHNVRNPTGRSQAVIGDCGSNGVSGPDYAGRDGLAGEVP
jgi:hypothetical protein